MASNTMRPPERKYETSIEPQDFYNAPSLNLSQVSTEQKSTSSSDESEQKEGVASKLVKKLKKTTSRKSKPENGGLLSKSPNASDPVFHNAAFNPSQAGEQDTSNSKKLLDRAVKTARTVGSSIKHPKEAAKHKATKTTAAHLSGANRPFLSTGADLDYLKAHDDLKQAETGRFTADAAKDQDEDTDESIEHRRMKVKQMEEHRESLRAAWTTSRHVRRVKVINNQRIVYTSLEQYTRRNEHGQIQERDTLRWLGNYLIYFTQAYTARYIDDTADQPFDIDTTRHLIERLIMVSAPWQSFLMKTRAVARWEDSVLTSKWLALYLFLWYTQYIVSYLYGYIIYMVLRNYFYPSSVDSLRSSIQRALESRDDAHRISELVDRHGSGNWLEPFLEEFGPVVQNQLSDTVEMIEVLFNFYHWMSPYKTVATLFFFSSCLLISLLTDMRYCVKIVWFIAGLNFFISIPISSRYPKYRHLISSIKWVYWDIPTHAEWSFEYLQRQAQKAARARASGKGNDEASPSSSRPSSSSSSKSFSSARSSVSSLPLDDDELSTDIRSFRAYLDGGILGRLSVSTTDLRFVRSRLLKKKLMNSDKSATKQEDDDDTVWRFHFSAISVMQKFDDGGQEAGVGSNLKDKVAGRFVKAVSSINKPVNSVSGAGGKGSGGLEITFTDGTTVIMHGMRERDEAFNAVIAFSGLQWQNLQGGPRART